MTHSPLSYAHNPDSGPLVLGIAADGDHVVAVGGQGSDFYIVSEDGGTFEPRASPGRGLRSAWIDGNDVWVCGEYGYAAHSPDRGHTWHELQTGTSSCLFGVGVVDGELYLAGDNGFLVRANRDGELEHIELTQSGYSRFSPHRDGLLLPSDEPGQLFVVGPTGAHKMCINGGSNLMKARVLDSGTVLVVGGSGNVFRSEDNGEAFRRVRGDFQGLLCGLEALGDEVYIVGQDRQIWRSTDDGRTFTAVEHDLGSGYFWCCERVGDVLMIGCHGGAVIQIGEFANRSAGTPPMPTPPANGLPPQTDVGPPQPFVPKQRPPVPRKQSFSTGHPTYFRSEHGLEGEVKEMLDDQPRAKLDALPSDLDVVDTLLANPAKQEFRVLVEHYAGSRVPDFEGFEVRIGRRTPHSRAALIDLLAEAYDDDEARALAAKLRESVELLAADDGTVLLAANDGVWEWREHDPGLRLVCADIGILYSLLIRAAAARLGRYDADELERELDAAYDDWLELEFFEQSVEMARSR